MSDKKYSIMEMVEGEEYVFPGIGGGGKRRVNAGCLEYWSVVDDMWKPITGMVPVNQKQLILCKKEPKLVEHYHAVMRRENGVYFLTDKLFPDYVGYIIPHNGAKFVKMAKEYPAIMLPERGDD